MNLHYLGLSKSELLATLDMRDAKIEAMDASIKMSNKKKERNPIYLNIGMKTSNQIAEDQWEVRYPMMQFSESETVRDIYDWASKYKHGDISFNGFIEQITKP